MVLHEIRWKPPCVSYMYYQYHLPFNQNYFSLYYTMINKHIKTWILEKKSTSLPWFVSLCLGCVYCISPAKDHIFFPFGSAFFFCQPSITPAAEISRDPVGVGNISWLAPVARNWDQTIGDPAPYHWANHCNQPSYWDTCFIGDASKTWLWWSQLSIIIISHIRRWSS